MERWNVEHFTNLNLMIEYKPNVLIRADIFYLFGSVELPIII